jgi:hypothetical protein
VTPEQRDEVATTPDADPAWSVPGWAPTFNPGDQDSKIKDERHGWMKFHLYVRTTVTIRNFQFNPYK